MELVPADTLTGLGTLKAALSLDTATGTAAVGANVKVMVQLVEDSEVRAAGEQTTVLTDGWIAS